MALTTRQLDYLARQDSHHKPIFKGVFASDQLPKEKEIQTRSADIVNVDTHDKQGSHWLSIFVENDQCEVFDSYGLPIHWYKPSPFVTWVFKGWFSQVHKHNVSITSENTPDISVSISRNIRRTNPLTCLMLFSFAHTSKHKHKHKKNEHVCFSCAYAYAYAYAEVRTA